MTRPRKHMPISVKLRACLILLGFDLDEPIEWDHTWALKLRPFNEETGDYDPPELDPRYIVPLRPADHDRKTFGNGATTRGGDIGTIAHTKRLTKKEEAFRRRLLAKAEGKTLPPKSKRPIRSRGFQKAGERRSG